jgi:hypothetical protein
MPNAIPKLMFSVQKVPGTITLIPKQKPHPRCPGCRFFIISVHFGFYAPGTVGLFPAPRTAADAEGMKLSNIFTN